MLAITPTTTLQQLTRMVGSKNVEAILHENNLDRVPNIGQVYAQYQAGLSSQTQVDRQRKTTILNVLTSDTDIFELATMASDNEWKTLSYTGALNGYLRVPETILLPESTNVIGNGIPVPRRVYDTVIRQIQQVGKSDPALFNEYSTRRSSNIVDSAPTTTSTFNFFNIPWGEVSLYSSLSNTSMDIPCYPEEVSESKVANYDQMPDLMYQYEPWNIYKNSGPRTKQFTVQLHRDMWTGDHRDGMCNKLIRFCEANCYPEYKGATVNTSTVTLYIHGKVYISGIMTEVKTDWSGPIGLDGFYLYCEMMLSITEVSQVPLSYSVVKSMGVIS